MDKISDYVVYDKKRIRTQNIWIYYYYYYYIHKYMKNKLYIIQQLYLTTSTEEEL